MQQGLVTVVLPIYNVEKYLDRCVSSVVNQTYRNLEIILVDDGSPDNCPEMCEQWAARDNRIRVVHKKNAGLGMARNTGIEHATGEYICFFDSDDYIAPDTIEKCYTAASTNRADIVSFGLRHVNAEGKVVSVEIPKVQKQIFSGEEIQSVFLADMISPDPNGGSNTGLRMSAWAAMFAMRVINKNNWRFVSEREIISEDVYSLLRLYDDVEQVVVLPEAFYYYCENGASLTHTYRADRFRRIKHFYYESIKLCNQLNYKQEVVRRLARTFLSYSIAALKLEASAKRPLRDRWAAVKEIVSDEALQSVLQIGTGKLDSIARKILFFAIEHKLYTVCFLLSRLKK